MTKRYFSRSAQVAEAHEPPPKTDQDQMRAKVRARIASEASVRVEHPKGSGQFLPLAEVAALRRAEKAAAGHPQAATS